MKEDGNINTDPQFKDKVSIVIPFFNCKYVDIAVKSAIDQTYKNTEIIVVDDGSTRFTEKLNPFLEDITYIKKNNGGTATALNKGIRSASGSYFVWLSSDDVLEPCKVEKQLNFMKQRKASISFTNFNWIDTNNTLIRSSVSPKYSNQLSLYKAMKRGCPINGSTVMIHFDLFSKVGLFDETFIYTHDYDLWNRIILKYDMHFLDQPLTCYRVHEEMGTRKYPKAILKEVNTIQRRYRNRLGQLILQS